LITTLDTSVYDVALSAAKHSDVSS